MSGKICGWYCRCHQSSCLSRRGLCACLNFSMSYRISQCKFVSKLLAKLDEIETFLSTSGQEMAIHQLYGLLITTAIAGLGGLLSGLLIKIPFVDKMNPSEYFDDRKDWETDGVFANDRHDDVEAWPSNQLKLFLVSTQKIFYWWIVIQNYRFFAYTFLHPIFIFWWKLTI